MVELALDGRDVGKDVRVVELEVVEDRHPRPVVDELAALVEERGVVLVRLHDEFPPATEPCRNAEILGHATDQEAGLAPGGLEQVRQDRARRGLAVGPRDREDVPSGQDLLGEPLRAGGVGTPIVEHLLHRVVAARQRVADHHRVAVGRYVARVVPLVQRDAQPLELGGHGRIDRAVAAFDVMAEFPGQGGDAAHEGSGDAEDVESVHAGDCRRRERVFHI